MIRKWFRRASWTNRLQFLFLSAIAYPVGLFAFGEFVTGVIELTWPVREGVVVSRNDTQRWIVFPSVRLSVMLSHNGQMVFAEMAGSEGSKIPERVLVHYSGNPHREVRIVGEESPWWGLLGAVALWVCPLIVLWLTGTWPEYSVG